MKVKTAELILTWLCVFPLSLLTTYYMRLIGGWISHIYSLVSTYWLLFVPFKHTSILVTIQLGLFTTHVSCKKKTNHGHLLKYEQKLELNQNKPQPRNILRHYYIKIALQCIAK